MGICLSNEDQQLIMNSQYWLRVQDFLKKYGKMNEIQVKQWCQKNIHENIQWLLYFQYPFRSNEIVQINRSQKSYVIAQFNLKRQNRQKWRRIKYLSIEREDNFEIITMIAIRQFWYDSNLIFHDDKKAQIYYKCIFYFDLKSGLITKIVFITIHDKNKQQRKLNDQDIIIDITNARPYEQKRIQEEKRQKQIKQKKTKQQKQQQAKFIYKPTQTNQRDYIKQGRQKDKKYDNERNQRQASHRRAQQSRDQQRRQWQYQRQRQAYKRY